MFGRKALLGASLLVLLGLTAALGAQGEGAKKKAPAEKKAPAGKAGASKMLLPDWKPEVGSYEQPHGTLGSKPSDAWTTTTIASSVDQKPLKGEIVTLKGEVIDYSCYLQLGKHGKKHESCGQKCLRNGQPIGLLARDGTIYLLMEEEHDPRRDSMTSFRDAALDHFSHVMEVSGTLSRVDGQRAIYVQGFVKK